MGLEFKDVAAAALALAPVLLHEWMGGKRQGVEWVGERRSNGGIGDSWSVNLRTGQWLHGAGDERGGDLISLYAALNQIDQVVALEAVAKMTGKINPNEVKVLPLTLPPPRAPDPIPDIFSEIPLHHQYGKHTALYFYDHFFVIARYDPPGERKQFCPWTWREGRWQPKAYPAPRPLYGVSLLEKWPTAAVMVVEGEKCADVVRQKLRAYVGITWSGGASAVKKTDWSPLKNRDVIIWPDADDPGHDAAAKISSILLPIAGRVRVIIPGSQPKGWDIAAAFEDGWDSHDVTKWATSNIRTVNIPEDPAPQPIAARSASLSSIESADTIVAARGPSPQDVITDSVIVNWNTLKLDCNQGGIPHPTMANGSLILRHHPFFAGKFWYDVFRDKIYHTMAPDGYPRVLRDVDVTQTTAFMQEQLKLPKMHSRIVQESILHAAMANKKNSLTDWLNSLVWDGRERLDTWLTDCLGCDYNDYTCAIARNWAIAMIARALVPGCKMDNMPVLEGKQGLNKTSFLEILGGDWYKACPQAFGDKDFLQTIRGAWIVEIPDMTGFRGRDHVQILAAITVRIDEYRSSYSRFSEAYPRTSIFAATTETNDYLSDMRGRRRYWPIRCQKISLDALRQQRSQIFAEAMLRYKAGESWWDVPSRAGQEQDERVDPDVWQDIIMGYMRLGGQTLRLSTSQILTRAIEMAPGRQDDKSAKRVARIMRENGCYQKRSSTGRWWVLPEWEVPPTPAPVTKKDDFND